VERIVSLIPSTTEIACALGFENALVGRSHECDHPAGVARLPALTQPKLDVDAGSRAIDDRVRQLVGDALSVYRVDVELLRELKPTLILTQDQCQVCAASLKDVEAALSEWLGDPPRVVSLNPKTLADVWGDIETVAEALREPERGRRLTLAMTERVTDVGERALRIREQPRVACIEWLDPLMGAGNWVPELVRLAGGQPLFGEAGAHTGWLEWDALRDADPDVIVLLPCGFDIARTRTESAALLAQPGWDALRAVRQNRVFAVDGNQFFNRPGPRLVESLEILAEILHPAEFAASRRDSGWQPL
jgi:iron complex transport system substrate-binding protein